MLDRINIKNHSADNISRVQLADDDQNQNTLPEHKCNTDPEGSVKVGVGPDPLPDKVGGGGRAGGQAPQQPLLDVLGGHVEELEKRMYCTFQIPEKAQSKSQMECNSCFVKLL